MTTATDTTRVDRGKAQPEPLDVQRVRRDFPILGRMVHDKPLVYLDSAATSQKPQSVIDALDTYYTQTNANVHRGLHELSEKATAAYEQARDKVRRFINAAETRQVIFVRGTTEAINLVAQSHGRSRLRPGDEVLITHMEHHSNIVPWQILCEQTGATLRVAPINDRGELLLDEFEKLLSKRTKLVAVVHISNALGTINPVKRIVELAHAHGAVVVVDGAQAAPHTQVDVQALGCDFFAFSGHKVFGPTGVGVLYGRAELLDAMAPYQSGGDMIKSVSFEKTIYNDLPFKFEAGTPNIAGVIGLGAAIDYVQRIGIDRIEAHEQDLLAYGTEALSAVPGLKLIGTARDKAAVFSFVLDGVHPHDVGTIVDGQGVAIRTGHHCAQPVMERFGIPATARASLALYNTRDDIDALVKALREVVEVFR
ncbi:MAG: cysteine desulfurase [Phycisphaeraceae bacterium]